jgi:hypothetical protein
MFRGGEEQECGMSQRSGDPPRRTGCGKLLWFIADFRRSVFRRSLQISGALCLREHAEFLGAWHTFTPVATSRIFPGLVEDPYLGLLWKSMEYFRIVQFRA